MGRNQLGFPFVRVESINDIHVAGRKSRNSVIFAAIIPLRGGELLGHISGTCDPAIVEAHPVRGAIITTQAMVLIHRRSRDRTEEALRTLNSFSNAYQATSRPTFQP